MASRSLAGRTSFIAEEMMSDLKRQFEQEFPNYLTIGEAGRHEYKARTSLRNITFHIRIFYPGEQDQLGYPILRMTYRLYVSEDGSGMGDLKRRGKMDWTGTDHLKPKADTIIDEMIEKVVDVADEVPKWKTSRRCEACHRPI